MTHAPDWARAAPDTVCREADLRPQPRHETRSIAHVYPSHLGFAFQGTWIRVQDEAVTPPYHYMTRISKAIMRPEMRDLEAEVRCDG